MCGYRRDAQLQIQAAVNTSCWHKAFVLYMSARPGLSLSLYVLLLSGFRHFLTEYETFALLSLLYFHECTTTTTTTTTTINGLQ